LLNYAIYFQFMVTGDHQLTACAIARQIGLINEEEPSLVGQYPSEYQKYIHLFSFFSLKILF
jgi:magnesium-transporting ATPase (P-type)